MLIRASLNETPILFIASPRSVWTFDEKDYHISIRYCPVAPKLQIINVLSTILFNNLASRINGLTRHTHTCEWHIMTRMTGPDCAVMCN